MDRIEFINATGHAIWLPGPDGNKVQFTKFERKALSSWFRKYVPRYLKEIRSVPQKQPKQVIVQRTNSPVANAARAVVARSPTRQKPGQMRPQTKIVPAHSRNPRKIVGRVDMQSGQATGYLNQLVQRTSISISNDIGIGVLSYNRLECLHRVLQSIRRHTDLSRTTVFVSDESDDDSVREYLNEIGDMIVITGNRLGVAGNSNRLLRCLARFRYKILLNDDVEILGRGWDNHYFLAMEKTGFHHFCYRQKGIYGASSSDGAQSDVNGLRVQTITEKPHGAVMAFDHKAFVTVGYFDESFGVYGMEHVDWSNRVSLSGIQPPGFHDVLGSDSYFRIHGEATAVQDKSASFNSAKRIYESVKAKKDRIHIKPTDRSVVQRISYIIPFRGEERKECIKTVLQNIKAQRFPQIEIVMAEQDEENLVKLIEFESVKYVLSKNLTHNQPFTKALAFNLGVSLTNSENLVLHDADMLVFDGYTAQMDQLLGQHEAVHIGKNVLYLNPESTSLVNGTGKLTIGAQVERSVKYYEGGSLGCKYNVFVRVGGLNEEFVGYGCFTPGNYVLTKHGYKLIEDVLPSDQLYTHEGQFRPIELRTRRFSGEVLDIFVPGRLPIKGVTPEHPFLVPTENDKLMWKRADELVAGNEIIDTDFLPELVDPYDLREIMRFDRSKNSFNIFDYMDEFCYLLGMYIAEGVLQTPDRLHILYFFLDKEETFLAEHIEKVVKTLNDDINVMYEHVKNNCRDVRVFNSLLAKLIHAVAGKFHARQKAISYNFLQTLSDVNLEYLLGGLCDGDVNHSKGSRKRVIYHTSSINMAMLVSGMMRRLGIAHSFGKRSGGSFDGSAEYGFDICVNREFEHRLRMIYPKAPLEGSSSMGRSKFGKILEIRRRQYDGPVYNFEVQDDHSYIVNGVCAHNCEDTEFFDRLSKSSRFFNDRSIDLVHLWHGRTAGWKQHHDRNKQLEAFLKQVPMQDRVNRLNAVLHEKYGLVYR